MIRFWEAIQDRISGKAPKGAKRNPGWTKFRKTHLNQFPDCYVCGAVTKLQVHHIVPFHVAPDLELNPENVLTLCTGGKHKGLNCHLIFGHHGNYKKVNIDCLDEAVYWRGKLL